MAEFLEFEIKEFEGEASSNRNPSKNQCQLCRNFDTRFIKGDLTVRPGYMQKYVPPASADHRSKLSDIEYLSFDNIYIPDGGGQEITIWVAKATLAAETAMVGSSYAEPSAINIGAIFTSHQFNGTAWDDVNWDGSTTGKYWLNHTILTKIESVDATAGNNFKLTLQFADADLVTDGLNNWTIVKIDPAGIIPAEVAHIIDTESAGANQVLVHITSKDHSWVAGDTVLIMKNYIPYNALIEMFNVTASDISFHKVLSDLRIGFGGQINRLGLSVGYRKKYWKIASTEMGSPTLSEVRTIDNLILDVYNGLEQDTGIDIETTTPGDLVAATRYQFKLIGILDGFNKILLAENSIEWVTGTYSLVLDPKIRCGTQNKRLTGFELYGAAGENAPFFLLKTYELSSNTLGGGEYVIKDSGYLYLESTFLDIHTSDNAVLQPAGATQNAITGWTAFGTDSASLAAVTTAPTPQNGTHSMKVTHTYTTKARAGAFYAKILSSDLNYNFNLYAQTSSAISITLYFVYNILGVISYKAIKSIALPATTWTNINETFSPGEYGIPGHTEVSVIGIAIDALLLPSASSGFLAIDNFHLYQETLSLKTIDQSSFDNAKLEMTARLNYPPTFDMVRSWDQAIVTSGRTFVIGAYIDKRIDTVIYGSIISGTPAFMYDVITVEKNITPMGKDEIIGIEVLPNLDLLVGKKNSVQYVDPDSGYSRGIYFIDGIISRRSMQNFGDKIMWCGENDIYVSDGLNVLPITD